MIKKRATTIQIATITKYSKSYFLLRLNSLQLSFLSSLNIITKLRVKKKHFKNYKVNIILLYITPSSSFSLVWYLKYPNNVSQTGMKGKSTYKIMKKAVSMCLSWRKNLYLGFDVVL